MILAIGLDLSVWTSASFVSNKNRRLSPHLNHPTNLNHPRSALGSLSTLVPAVDGAASAQDQALQWLLLHGHHNILPSRRGVLGDAERAHRSGGLAVKALIGRSAWGLDAAFENDASTSLSPKKICKLSSISKRSPSRCWKRTTRRPNDLTAIVHSPSEMRDELRDELRAITAMATRDDRKTCGGADCRMQAQRLQPTP